MPRHPGNGKFIDPLDPDSYVEEEPQAKPGVGPGESGATSRPRHVEDEDEQEE